MHIRYPRHTHSSGTCCCFLHLIKKRTVHYPLPLLGHSLGTRQASTLRRRLFFAPIMPSFAEFSECSIVFPKTGINPRRGLEENKIKGNEALGAQNAKVTVSLYPTDTGACTPQYNICRYTRSKSDQSYTLLCAQEAECVSVVFCVSTNNLQRRHKDILAISRGQLDPRPNALNSYRMDGTW